IPRENTTIIDNWDVNGLRGTGSHDIEVTGIVVPEHWTFIRGGAASLDTPLFRYPTLAIASQVLAVVGLGAARAALDQAIAMARGRASITRAAPARRPRPPRAGARQGQRTRLDHRRAAARGPRPCADRAGKGRSAAALRPRLSRPHHRTRL